MRTVTGPTDRVVVVGAGLGGLACALRLAGAGRRVTVLERAALPGGRAGLLELGGYRFDTGPTVLTMPDLIADTLGAVGERMDDWLTLHRLDPAYRAHYPDGSTLDLRTDTAAMAAEVSRACGPREADGYLRLTDHLRELYRLEFADFIDRNLDSPRDLLTLNLLRLAARGGFGRLYPQVGRFLADPRTRRLFTFQALYAGLSPFRALALYAVISYLDGVAGVFHPVGGVHAVPRALAGAAVRHGVEIHYGREVTAVTGRHGRATGVRTADGGHVPADVVVLNPDLPIAYRDLLGARPPRLRYSPSAVLLHLGASAGFSKIAHHNIHFGRSYRGTFRDLIDRGRLMGDPSLLVGNPSRTDPALAPPGRHSYHVLAPVPNATAGIDWSATGPRYRDELLDVLSDRGYRGLSAGIEVERLVTPAEWAAAGMAAGTPFASAHSFWQTGPFRAGNLAAGWENVVFVGSGTQPGVGVPMVLVSGRLAAERVTGGGDR